MIEFLGWIGTALLAFCGVPLAWDAFKKKHADGLSGTFLWTWYLGELFLFFYCIFKKDVVLLTNYGINIVLLSVVVYYKYRRKL